MGGGKALGIQLHAEAPCLHCLQRKDRPGWALTSWPPPRGSLLSRQRLRGEQGLRGEGKGEEGGMERKIKFEC